MVRYNYEELKSISKKVRAELASEGIIIKKKARRRPRDVEKKMLIFEMALNRLKKYKPQMAEKGIILPYYRY